MIKLANVRFRYPGSREEVLLIDDVTIEQDGQLQIVVGPNGSGKTTLCKIICGILAVRGASVPTPPPVLFWQDLQLFPTLTGRNLELVCSSAGEVEKLLDDFGLGAFKKVAVGSLSGGQRNKLALARVLATKRNTIVFDEPTSSLDPGFIDIFARELAGMTGMTRIVVTHDPPFFSLLTSRDDAMVYVLDPREKGGRLSKPTPIRQFLNKPPTVYAAKFLGYENFFSVPAGVRANEPARIGTLGEITEMPRKVVIPIDALELSNNAFQDGVLVQNAREEFRSGGQRVVRVAWVRGGGYERLEFVAPRNDVRLDRKLYLRLADSSRVFEVAPGNEGLSVEAEG